VLHVRQQLAKNIFKVPKCKIFDLLDSLSFTPQSLYGLVNSGPKCNNLNFIVLVLISKIFQHNFCFHRMLGQSKNFYYLLLNSVVSFQNNFHLLKNLNFFFLGGGFYITSYCMPIYFWVHTLSAPNFFSAHNVLPYLVYNALNLKAHAECVQKFVSAWWVCAAKFRCTLSLNIKEQWF